MPTPVTVYYTKPDGTQASLDAADLRQARRTLLELWKALQCVSGTIRHGTDVERYVGEGAAQLLRHRLERAESPNGTEQMIAKACVRTVFSGRRKGNQEVHMSRAELEAVILAALLSARNHS